MRDLAVVGVCMRRQSSTYGFTHFANAFLNFTSKVSSTIRLFISSNIMMFAVCPPIYRRHFYFCSFILDVSIVCDGWYAGKFTRGVRLHEQCTLFSFFLLQHTFRSKFYSGTIHFERFSNSIGYSTFG